MWKFRYIETLLLIITTTPLQHYIREVPVGISTAFPIEPDQQIVSVLTFAADVSTRATSMNPPSMRNCVYYEEGHAVSTECWLR
jgi:hypothetical protein